jgi:hypothetical protein
MCDGLYEFVQLTVAVGDGVKRSRREEALLEVADRALDASLLLRLPWGAEPRLHVHSRRQVEQERMKAYDITLPIDDDGLGVVEQPLTG